MAAAIHDISVNASTDRRTCWQIIFLLTHCWIGLGYQGGCWVFLGEMMVVASPWQGPINSKSWCCCLFAVGEAAFAALKQRKRDNKLVCAGQHQAANQTFALSMGAKSIQAVFENISLLGNGTLGFYAPGFFGTDRSMCAHHSNSQVPAPTRPLVVGLYPRTVLVFLQLLSLSRH